MEFKLTRESMELLVDQIIETVESFSDYDRQCEAVTCILEANGIVQIEGDE